MRLRTYFSFPQATPWDIGLGAIFLNPSCNQVEARR
jgi:hypothetical protein